MREHVRLYATLIRARARAQLQYRTSFVLAMLGSTSITAVEFVSILILFSRVPSIAGWTMCEVALLYGIAEATFATAELLGSALDDFNVRIRTGTFDKFLTRPRGTFFQVLAEDLALRRLGRVAQGCAVLAFAVTCAHVVWTPDKVLVLAIAFASGLAIFFSIFVLSAAFCFWSVEGKEAMHVFSYGGVALSDYPIDVYADWLRRFVTFILPLAFVSYYPALYLLDRPDVHALPDWVRLLSPLAAALMLGLAWVGWSRGVRHYQSTGS
jgi:ABC-2 type transport system permease protein